MVPLGHRVMNRGILGFLLESPPPSDLRKTATTYLHFFLYSTSPLCQFIIIIGLVNQSAYIITPALKPPYTDIGKGARETLMMRC
jgi:hypothetical protein